MWLSVAFLGREEAVWTGAGHSSILFLYPIARKYYLNSINTITLCGLQLNVSIHQIQKYQKAFLTFLFLRDKVLQIQHVKFCIFVVQLPGKSKEMWLVSFLERYLNYWMIPMCWSSDILIVWLSLKHTLDFRPHTELKSFGTSWGLLGFHVSAMESEIMLYFWVLWFCTS